MNGPLPLSIDKLCLSWRNKADNKKVCVSSFGWCRWRSRCRR